MAIVAVSAYADATGNGKRPFIIDIHQAHLRGRIRAKVVGVHKTIILVISRLIKGTVELEKRLLLPRQILKSL